MIIIKTSHVNTKKPIILFEIDEEGNGTVYKIHKGEKVKLDIVLMGGVDECTVKHVKDWCTYWCDRHGYYNVKVEIALK